MGIAAGTYDRRVTISAATPIQSTATGQMVVAWVAVLTNIPARIKYDSGNQQYQAEQRVSTQTVTFEIRYANGIKPGQRVECEGKFYNIQYVAELGRRVALQLSCEQKDNETTQAAGIPPSNVVAPTIAPSGTQQTGTVLTVSPGTWVGTTPITYNYRWTRNGTPITGATAATYTIQVADDAATIRCEVQATNAFGSSAFVASSNSATGANPTAPVNTVAPVVSGNPVVGQTLSTTNGTWSGIPAPTFTYQWQRNGNNITGATAQTYILQQADAATNIRCVVTATNIAGNASANSNTISVAPLLLLDLYPNAAAAYSVRKLRSAYLGAAIRVRRSSDNAEQDIGFTGTGDLDETALTAFVGANDGFVVTWYDQSGNGLNATQPTPTNQPKIVNSGVLVTKNSKPSISIIDNSTSTLLQYFIVPVWHSSTAVNVFSFCVYSQGVTNDFPYLLGSTPNDKGFILMHLDSSLRTGTVRSVLSIGASSATFSSGVLFQRTDTANRTNIITYKDGNQVINITDNNSNFDLPAFYFTGNTNAVSVVGDMNLSEQIFYETDQSANRIAIENNQKSFYGI